MSNAVPPEQYGSIHHSNKPANRSPDSGFDLAKQNFVICYRTRALQVTTKRAAARKPKPLADGRLHALAYSIGTIEGRDANIRR
jgi:hypothetical protein